MRWWERERPIFGLEEDKVCEDAPCNRHLGSAIWGLLFLLLLSWSLWIFVAQTSDPLHLHFNGWEEGFQAGPRASNTPAILGTQIYTKRDADKFRRHLACFSETGKWKLNNTARKLPWNFAGDPFANQCDGRHVNTSGNVAGVQADAIKISSDWKVREELKWVWRSSRSCPMVPFNRNHFCRLIGPNRNMLLVGDSINHELQWVLLNNFLNNVTGIMPSLSSVRTWEGYQVCDDILGPNKGFKIGFIRNDRLSPTLEVKDDGWSNILEWPWLPAVSDWNIKILVLNRGAHYEPDNIYTAALEETLALLRNYYPHLLVMFRNTPPGHKNCNMFTTPIQERQKDLPIEWHWGEFRRQNGLAKEIVERHQYIYIDVDTALSLRPDGHIDRNDCLHYCLPGPLDYIAELLYNIFSTIDNLT